MAAISGKAAPITPRGADMRATLASPEVQDDLFVSTTKLSYKGALAGEREHARPSSKTRHNNPHANSFKSRQLPSGQIINVSTGHEGPGMSQLTPRGVGEEAYRTPRSVVGVDYQEPHQSAWQKGNTKRYGSNAQPWANATVPARGIVPQVNSSSLTSLSTAAPTTREAYSGGLEFGGGAPLSSRRAPSRLDDSDADDIKAIVKDDISAEVESWIERAPGFEGEVVKRMIREVSAKARTPRTEAKAQLGATSPEAGSPTKGAGAPQYSFVSSWSGPLVG